MEEEGPTTVMQGLTTAYAHSIWQKSIYEQKNMGFVGSPSCSFLFFFFPRWLISPPTPENRASSQPRQPQTYFLAAE